MGKDLKGKELGVGISQQKDGFYSARFVDKFGKRQQKRFKKLQDCRQWIADATFNDKHNDSCHPLDLTVDAWYECWIDIKEKTTRYGTCKNYKTAYKYHIKPVIGKMLLKDVKPIHCQNIFSIMIDNDLKTNTLKITRAALHNMFKFAEQNDIIVSNPCKSSLKSVGKSTESKEALTIEVQKKFLEIIKGHPYENQFRFILQTGLRTGELIGLRWEDIDFKAKTLMVKRTMVYQQREKNDSKWQIGEPKTKNGRRVIPLTDEAISILKNQKEKNLKKKLVQMEWSDLVFLNKLGRPTSNQVYNTALYTLCQNNNIKKFGMHVLRHTFATRCIEGGMKPKTLQMILGHSSIGVTMNLYVHTTEDEKQKEIELVSNALKVI